MTKRRRSKCSTKQHEPEVTMKEYGPGGCMGGRPILWNSSGGLLYCATPFYRPRGQTRML